MTLSEKNLVPMKKKIGSVLYRGFGAAKTGSVWVQTRGASLPNS